MNYGLKLETRILYQTERICVLPLFALTSKVVNMIQITRVDKHSPICRSKQIKDDIHLVF